MFRAPCSELPNDNPRLHEGAVWIRATPCGPLEAVVEAEPAPGAIELAPVALAAIELAPIEPAAIELAPIEPAAIELAPIEPAAIAPAAIEEERAASTITTPPPSDAFGAFVQALVAIALASGAPRAAAALPDLLEAGRLADGALDAGAVEALVSRGLVTRAGEELRATDALAAPARAWADVLRGDGDMSACGSSTLNEWAAEVLAAVLGAPARAQALQTELRRHGVAAFGLVRLAA